MSSLGLINRGETLKYLHPADGCHNGQWLENMTQRERLREYDLLSLKRKLMGKPIAVHN